MQRHQQREKRTFLQRAADRFGPMDADPLGQRRGEGLHAFGTPEQQLEIQPRCAMVPGLEYEMTLSLLQQSGDMILHPGVPRDRVQPLWRPLSVI
jgi:hypothetical protein